MAAKANWWTEVYHAPTSAGSHFKVNFNSSSGTVHVESYVWNGEYLNWGCCVIRSMWVQSAFMYFSTDGINYVPFYWFGFDHGTQTTSVPFGGYNTSTYTSSSNTGDRILNMDLQLINSIKNVKKIKIIAHLVSDDPILFGGPQDIEDTKDVTVPQMSTINTPTYQFLPVQANGVYSPKARVGFTKLSLNEVDNVSSMILYDGSVSPNAKLIYLPIATSGSADVPVSNTPKVYYYQQVAYNERWSLNSATVTVPAFTFPTSASASYDPVSQQVKFSWTMDPVSSPNVITDRFKLQIADNANFTDAREVSVDYDPAKSSFSYIVDKDFSPQMYFRVARASFGFNWELAKMANVTLSFTSIPVTAKAELLNKAAKLTWDPVPSAWLPGSTFIITKLNNTSKTQSEIRLNKQDFDKGTYTDVQITTCNSYNYSLQVVPPATSKFTAFSPVQIPNEILPTEIGSLIKLDVSKGYFPDRTELRWSTNGGFDNFIIKRAVYGTNNFVQVATVPGSINSEYQTDDSKGTPGVYYTYQVIGAVKCNNTTVFSNETLSGVGFRSPTGNIYGRVTYENGQSVEDVSVRLQSNDQVQLGKSIYLDGSPDSYLKPNNSTAAYSDSAFTVEMWIKPDDANPTLQFLFYGNNQYVLGFDDQGKLFFSFQGNGVGGDYSNPNGSFVHVTGIRTKDSMFLLLNNEIIGRAAVPYSASTPDNTVYIGRGFFGQNFKGYIDEVRLYNTALSLDQAVKNYTRLAAGDEPGLAAYYRFDETITDQFYDLSFHGETYNRNDGTMSPTAVKRSTVIPTQDQLSLKSFTDLSGNYFIAGIPYIGNGTTYTIVPLKGTHQFDPISVNRLISPSSTQFAVDFKDKSSFDVAGIVYYNNSTVPVSGVQFKIDGKLAQLSNGTITETDAAGKFVISVPVGVHEVQAVKNNHIFLNGGKITDLLGHNLNYQDNRAGIELYDSTTVRFIGRVAGGAVQDAAPLGHSVSVNNLGKDLSITMKLPSGDKYELYTGSTDKTVTNLHLLPSDQSDSNKIHKTRVVYQTNQIVIYPDSITGEFVADLIPEKFLATNVGVTGWGDLLDGKQVTIDFVDKFAVTNSTRAYVDSVQDNQGTWVKTSYVDTVPYNVSYKFIKRITPSVSIGQVDASGNPLPYFGSDTYQTLTFAGTRETVSIIDATKTGQDMYKFGRPVFNQNQLYHFLIKAFEAYPFYETVDNNGIPVIKQQGGKDVVDNVPTQDGFVSLFNSLRNGGTVADTLSLDNSGTGIYEFTAGDPDLASHGIKDFAATIRFGQATNITWQWYGEPKMSAYVLGGKLTGTDFITAGPDKLLMVLRDPPGSKSFSFAEKGSVVTTSSKYTGSIKNEGDEEFTQKLGYQLITWTGVAAGVINKVEAQNGIGFGIHHEEHYTGSDTKEQSTTLTTTFKTSDDPLFVGPPGDVFVGYSTNITYGQSNNITIIKRTELKASDITLYEPDPASTYLVVQRAGINIGEVFGTLFAYPQQHIEKILIPTLISIRNSALLPPTTPAATAQAMANNTNKIVYVSKLDAGDPNFGKSNSDTTAFGPGAKSAPFGNGSSYAIYFPSSSTYRTDTILALNQYVQAWTKRMADNEKAKLEATLVQNYSFHSGAPIEHSKETSTKTEHEDEFSFVIGGSVTNSTDVDILGNGFEFKFKEAISTEQGGTFGSSTENTMKYGFTLASEGTDDYFSVDVMTANDSAFVFRTKGGSSGCPYAGLHVTQYYQPGTVIDQPTLRNEVPVITVDNPVASNVPSSRKASYTLILKNESESKLPATFVLSYVNNDSVKGATISVDGLSIADGRAIPIQFGETIEKVLTIDPGPTAMDYNDIMILWHSGCQYDPTGYRENISDTVLLSAHFIPSCSDINIKFPTDKWVLNTSSPVNQQGKRYLPVTIDEFDVNNKLFDHIELQYKPSPTSTWITAMKFYADSTRYKAAQGEKQFIDNPAAINYNLVMDDAAFNDQHYDVQAVSFCSLGGANYVTTESNLVSGVKDTYNPQLFGSPQPANGVLTANDDVRLNFNETIAAGLLTSSDFQVTGVRNGAKRDHSVSVRLDGVSNYLATEFEKSFTGKNITAEMWILPKGEAYQTLFSHGDVNESMELALTVGNQMRITVGNKTVNSQAVDFKPGEWAHVALVYNDNNRTVSAFYNFVEMIHNAPVNAYTGTGRIEFGRSIRQLSSYFNGSIHEARIWEDTLNSIKLQINSLSVLSGAESSLIGYYPMNEGKGNLVFDKAHGSNAILNGLWNTSPGKGVSLNGNGYVKLNTSFAPVISTMDYTLELWFKGDASQGNATLASNGRGDGAEGGGSLNLFSLGFENGLLTYRNNGFKVQADGNYLDNKWHHVALAVNRNAGTAQLFVDGLLNQFFDAGNLGGVAAAFTYLGVRSYFTVNDAATPKFDRYFTGNIDEFRIWNTYLNQTLVSSNNNVRLEGNELGLLAYYPFETYIQFQGHTDLYYSLKDAKVQEVPSTVVPDAVAVNAAESDEAAPIKDRGPVDNLRFDFVVNNDALIINLLESKQAIDKTVVTFKSKDVRDLNGNKLLSPVTWTAYIDRNPLKWSDKEINLVKEVGAPMSFESRLVNSGGSSQKFTIYNLPTWLRADVSNGSVDPKGNQKITFTVSEGLNIGSYEEIIFMRNDNNETEALKIMLQVKGKKPDWVVKTADYDYNMAVYGKIRINNIFSTSKEDMLGAFINGKCVGVAANTYIANNDFWYVFLTVYWNEVSNSNLEFRIWQASTGKTFKASASQFISFAKDAIVGTVSQPVIFSTGGQMYQNMTVNQNWNWVSFNIAIPANTPLNTTLLNGNWTGNDIIKNEAPGGGPTTGFSSYVPNSGWKGSLASLDNLSLFKLKAANAQTLTISGNAVNVVTTPIPLRGAQWNYISYLPQINATLKEALANYGASDEDVIKSQTGFAMYSSQNGWIGSLTYLEPGKGYMLYRKRATDTAFRYPSINGSLGGRLQGGTLANRYENPVEGNFSHADNMTIAAIVGKEFDFRSGDSILAFVNGELRGKTRPVYNPEIKGNTFFFTIGGDAEQPVVFMVERRGELIAQSSTNFSYRTNSNLGTLARPIELHFVSAASGITVYPNPFNSNATISIDLRGYPAAQEHRVQLSVVDMTGRTVMQMPVKTVSGTGFTTSWNGRTAAGSTVANGVYFIRATVDGVLHVLKMVKQ